MSDESDDDDQLSPEDLARLPPELRDLSPTRPKNAWKPTPEFLAARDELRRLQALPEPGPPPAGPSEIIAYIADIEVPAGRDPTLEMARIDVRVETDLRRMATQPSLKRQKQAREAAPIGPSGTQKLKTVEPRPEPPGVTRLEPVAEDPAKHPSSPPAAEFATDPTFKEMSRQRSRSVRWIVGATAAALCLLSVVMLLFRNPRPVPSTVDISAASGTATAPSLAVQLLPAPTVASGAPAATPTVSPESQSPNANSPSKSAAPSASQPAIRVSSPDTVTPSAHSSTAPLMQAPSPAIARSAEPRTTQAPPAATVPPPPSTPWVQ